MSPLAQFVVSFWSGQMDGLRLPTHTRMRVNRQSKKVVARLVYAPTKTAQMPPYPPAMKDFAFSTTADALGARTDESPLCV